jgi:hypothetical protein
MVPTSASMSSCGRHSFVYCGGLIRQGRNSTSSTRHRNGWKSLFNRPSRQPREPRLDTIPPTPGSRRSALALSSRLNWLPAPGQSLPPTLLVRSWSTRRDRVAERRTLPQCLCLDPASLLVHPLASSRLGGFLQPRNRAFLTVLVLARRSLLIMMVIWSPSEGLFRQRET